MKMIAVYNLEPRFFNLALEKIRQYYENNGEEVDDYKPLWHKQYEKIYCSSIFTWTDKSTVTSDMICGGTGFNLTATLPLPIEKIRVYKNIGFMTRGCIRKCSFCVVPQKEGKIKIEGEIYDIWDGKTKHIILLDNNLLALPNHFIKICRQLRWEKLTVDFNQGLDIRLLDNDLVCELDNIRIKPYYRFAFDSMKDIDDIIRGIEIARKHKWFRASMWYVLLGAGESIENEKERIKILAKYNCLIYPMFYNQHSITTKLNGQHTVNFRCQKKYFLKTQRYFAGRI